MFTSRDFRDMQVGMFATRATTDEAFEDAVAMLKREGVDGIVAMTAIFMFSNTLLETLAKAVEKIES